MGKRVSNKLWLLIWREDVRGNWGKGNWLIKEPIAFVKNQRANVIIRLNHLEKPNKDNTPKIR